MNRGEGPLPPGRCHRHAAGGASTNSADAHTSWIAARSVQACRRVVPGGIRALYEPAARARHLTNPRLVTTSFSAISSLLEPLLGVLLCCNPTT